MKLLMSTRILFSLSVFFLLSSLNIAAIVPRPDHVVICILENHGYSQIINSPHAPYINSLVPHSAHLMEYYALTHPSQPNYLMLFSGGDQGETTDNLPSGTPWTTPNLGASLLNTGYTFVGYSEDLPNPGSTVSSSGPYARKHSPWVNWQGNGHNQIPASCNLSMSHFPTNYNQLPDLSFVIPNQNNDMHNGSDPGRIQTGDDWVRQHMKPYIDWAMNNNSLFILTFDEDDFSPVNHIPCLFLGQMVQQGNYYLNGYNHYDLLRTLEDMFTLPHAGNAAFATSIEEIWMQPTSISENTVSIASKVFPNPVTSESSLSVMITDSKDEQATLVVYDMAGRKMSNEALIVVPGMNEIPFKTDNLPNGMFTYLIVSARKVYGSGKFVVE